MTLDAPFLNALEAIAPVRRDEPLSRHTTIGIGGPADAYVIAQSADQLPPSSSLPPERDALLRPRLRQQHRSRRPRYTRRHHPERRRGSKPHAASLSTGSEPDTRRFRAEAGCSFAATARQLAFDGYAGLEWASGIPGTIGGAVVYNAGAYGGCLADVLQRVAVADADGERGRGRRPRPGLPRQRFHPRPHRGPGRPRAEFALWPGDAAELRARVADYDERRLTAQPRGRNAGSFFKNPPGQPAWKLIEAVGLRGYRVGDADSREKHCNFLINAGDAKAADVAALMQLARQRVHDQFGVELKNEVSLVGEGFGDA